MTQSFLERRIERARCDGRASMSLPGHRLTTLPESIGSLSSLTHLNLSRTGLIALPESIGNLSSLTVLRLSYNQLTELPESIGNLSNLTQLHIDGGRLTSLPKSIGDLTRLEFVDLHNNQLTSLPDIGKLVNLQRLHLSDNKISHLPASTIGLTSLTYLDINGNLIADLSILQALPNLETVVFMKLALPRRYWTKLSDWKAEWLLTEDNVEVRSALIGQLGYEKVCEELDTISLDTWREYTLLEIDKVVEETYDEDGDPGDDESIVLLKMTCPSTGHIHILRVPPEMTSAEDAINYLGKSWHSS